MSEQKITKGMVIFQSHGIGPCKVLGVKRNGMLRLQSLTGGGKQEASGYVAVLTRTDLRLMIKQKQAQQQAQRRADAPISPQ